MTEKERKIERALEEHFIGAGWEIDNLGDHFATTYVSDDDGGSTSVDINLSAIARDLADKINA